jgi:hypothetical protein
MAMLNALEVVDANLAPELAEALIARKLANNRDHSVSRDTLHFPELLEKVRLIKKHLLQVPLVHVTPDGFDRDRGLQSRSECHGSGGNTTGFDQSLGLHRYVFLRWGVPDVALAGMPRYGTTIVLVDPIILQDHGTIATPRDIGEVAHIDDTAYHDLDSGDRMAFDRGALDAVVTGKDWIGIVALKALEAYLEGWPCFPSPLDATHLGEIKHFGPVPSTLIRDVIPASRLPEHYGALAAHGFFTEGYGDDKQARRYWDEVFGGL